ncbi:MAG: hypothetical protein Q8K67_06900 [Geothrix sp.]|nr:hypothetical protein [Geothrix sp.]
MRILLHAILAPILGLGLLLGSLGSLAADRAPVQGQAPESCCCGTPAGMEDRCPCPRPEGNRGPSRGTCNERPAVVASQAAPRKGEQGRRRTESRPGPAMWAGAAVVTSVETGISFVTRGRDPDLGRHLARLSTLRV